MHPVLATRTRLGTYLLAWVPAAFLVAGQCAAVGWPFTDGLLLALPACLGAAALFLPCWYLCQVLPLRGADPLRLAGTWLAAAALAGLLWAGLAWALHQLLAALALLPGTAAAFPGALILQLAGTGAAFYGLTAVSHYLLIAQEQAREAEERGRELRELAREAELKALRAQLNPHFLFNSLNSISALTAADPRGARRMCVLLADFLRMSLKLGERAQVTLGEELELVRAYLEIERVRFGDRLRLDWAVAAEAQAAPLPPLLLQPLVENAVKHGIAQLTGGGGLTLRVTLPEPGRVSVELENDMAPDAAAPAGLGLGLEQVRRRLRGRFGDRSAFHCGARGGRFRVVLAFPAAAGANDD